MGSTTRFTSPQCADQGETTVYNAVIKDEDGVAISGALLNTLTLTLQTVQNQTIINSRSTVSVLNTGGGTVDGSGNFAMEFSPADNAIIDNTLRQESHEALFEWTYASGTRTGRHQVHFIVRNLATAFDINANGLTTLGAMKRYLNIADTSQDVVILNLINAVSDLFEELTGRAFLEATYTDDIFDPTGIPELLLTKPVSGELRALPVTVFTSIAIAGSVLGSADFQVNTKFGIVMMLNQVFFGVRGDVKVTWTGGYILQGAAVTPPQRALPINIEQAAKELIALKYRIETKQLGPGLVSISAAGESVSLTDDGIPKSVEQVLKQYTVAV